MLLNVAPVLLNCHLLGKTSTKRTNVIFVLYLLATVRVQLCCQLAEKSAKTQKELCKVISLTNPWPNFGQILPERAKRGPSSSTILSL
jgi:hypothetical protein